MKRNLTFTVLMLWTGLISCTDHQIPIQPGSTCRVTQNVYKTTAPVLPFSENLNYAGSTYRLGVNDTQKYQYNQQGLVTQAMIEFSISPQQANRLSTYEYLTNQIRENRSVGSSTNNRLIIYALNSQGYVASGNGAVYQYDANGYLISNKAGNATIIYTIENGNVIKTEETLNTPNGTILNSTLYEYDLSKSSFSAALGTPYFLISSEYQPIAIYFGKPSQNLLVKKTTNTTNTPTNGTISNSTSASQYIYYYNDQGNIKRVLTDISYTINGKPAPPNFLSVNDFDYECPK